MLKELPLPQAYRVTLTGLYLISTAYKGERNLQFAFRALGLSDEPAVLAIGIQDKNFSRDEKTFRPGRDLARSLAKEM